MKATRLRVGTLLLLVTIAPGSRRAAAASLAFAGETLRYDMSWGIFSGGVMTITTSEQLSFQDRPAYKIELSAISNDFISRFFVVRESITSWIDAESFQSLRFEKHSVEGRRVEDERIDFDQASRSASREGRAIAFDSPVFDSLSSVFYLRTRSLSPGETLELEVVSGKHAYRLAVDILPRELVHTPAGDFWAQKIHPKMKGEGLLKKGGDLWLWLALDSRRTPVVIRSKLNFGTLTARLSRGAPAAPPPGAGR